MATVKTTGITLTLSVEDVIALQILLNKIGGSPTKTRRGLLDAISTALDTAGFPVEETDLDDASGYIQFA